MKSMFWCSWLKGKRGDSGAALVEFALVVPALIILIGGVVEIGRAFSARAAFDTNSYWAVRAGATAGAAARSAAIEGTFSQLNNITNNKGMITSASFSPNAEQTSGLVAASGSAQLSNIWRATGLVLHSNYTSPDLLPHSMPDGLNGFANSGYFDCLGNMLSSPNTETCGPTSTTGGGWSYTCNGLNCPISSVGSWRPPMLETSKMN